MQNSLSLSPKAKKFGFPTLGRIAYFNDLGGKKRYIALGNWILQGVLRPLHDILIGYLRSLTADCTYNQRRVYSFYKEQVNKGNKSFYRLDLSRATDRLPVSLQASILESLFKRKELAENWLAIISGISFSTSVKGKLKSIKYRVGQGMGLYSS